MQKVSLHSFTAVHTFGGDAVRNGRYCLDKKRRLLQLNVPQFTETGVVFLFNTHQLFWVTCFYSVLISWASLSIILLSSLSYRKSVLPILLSLFVVAAFLLMPELLSHSSLSITSGHLFFPARVLLRQLV